MVTSLQDKKQVLARIFALLMVMASIMKIQAQTTQLTEIIIGDGNEESCEIPFNACTSGCSYVECIFPAEAIGGPCMIYSISFYCAKTWLDNSNYIYPQNYFYLKYYMGTTSQTSYNTSTNWTTPENYTKVFDRNGYGGFCRQIGWDSFVLDAPFYYDGGNLVIGILINASGWESFATPMTIAGSTTEGASIKVREIYSLPGANTEGTIVDFCPNIKLGVVYEALVSTPTSIEIGPRPNNCWIEPYQAFLFNEGIPVSITASTCDNNYFALSGFEFPRPCSLFETISYDLSTGVGEGSQTGNLTFNYGNNKTLEIPISAIAYNPSTPDVWEVAREIETFPYSETITSEMPVWDNYRLPGKIADGKDAVFKLDFESDVVLSAFISDGENGKVALYREGFEGQGGPSTDNYFNGLATDITDCQCDFEGGDLGNLDWVFEAPNSNEYWTVTTNNPHSGTYCMKSNSGCWSGNSSNCISFTRYVPHDITMSFWARISSETNCDKGYFFIDGVAKIDGISGNGDWIFYSYDVPQGLHTFKWEYRKDDDWCRNDDCFYVDDLFLWDAYTISLNCGLPVPQGSYYLIASSTSDQFMVNIEKIEIPFPIAATSPSPSDHFNCYDDNYSSLNWQLGGYTKEYQVLFGETNPPTTVLVDWTEELAESCTIDGLGDNKTYFWRVNERNSSGTTEGAVWTFTTFKDINASADNIIFVSPTGAGVKDGSSWVNAASSIQAAIDAAAAITENQPVVWVSKGNYYANGVYQTLNNKTCCFYSHDGVRLYGGFNGDETADYDLSLRDFENNATILDAESQCYVIGTRSGTWDGFVMQHGGEGGFYSYGETSTVQNCKILYSNGNGVQVGGGNLNCFHNEISYHSNVGIRKGYLTSALELKDCVISHNTQYGVWGTCKVERCYVCNNGNGVSSDSSRGGVLINSVVANNDGFGTDFTYVFNSTIVNNGTGIARCYYNMNLYLYNNIIWGNERQWDSNWSWSSFYSINLINNAIQGGAGDKGGVYPNITLAGRGEVGFSPDFVNPTSGIGSGYEGGDWSLLPTSPCVNFGYENIASFPNQGSFFNNYMPFSQLQDYMVFDIVGNPRTQNGRIDIGAIESSYDKPEIILPVRPDANNIIYVKADGDGDGSSWANAANLWDAIETSCLYESVPAIWVAQGTYIAPNLTFQIKGNMRLYGGFEGTEPANYDLTQRDYTNHPSVLDGNNTVRVLGQSHTLGIATAAVIDGFTLQNGLADNGAGAYLKENSTFSNCIVINNRTNDNSEGKGGGVYADGAFVENCSVKHNTGTIGGGMYLNKATVRDCFVENNTANHGGGIYANNSRIIQSHIGNNTAAEQAGGFYAVASDLLQCNIVSNANGGLLVCADDNGSYANLYNSILWGNSGSNLVYHSGMAQNNTTVSHCAIEGWSELSHGNIPLSADNEGDFGPHFTEDWQLGEASMCINAGNSTLPNEGMLLYDLNNNPRVQNDLVDIGAFESPYPALCREMEMLEVSIREGETYDFYGTLLSQPGSYEHSWMEDDCLHLVMLQLRMTLIYYVSETGNGNMDGSSWENALDGNTVLESGYTKLANALSQAQIDGCFWIARGTYLPCGDADASKHFILNEGVSVYGGFVGNETSLDERDFDHNVTIFSGELQGDEDETNNTDGILVTSASATLWNRYATLDGLTLTKGYTASHQGAALLVNELTSVTMNRCQVQYNYEGGIRNYGNLDIIDSDLSNNNTQEIGENYVHFISGYSIYKNAGALCNMDHGTATLSNCTLQSNYSTNNGAIFNSGILEIDASVFDNNTADCYGTIASPGKMKIHNTTFNNNRSDHHIAVMLILDSLELVNCEVTNNKSNYYTSTHFPSGGAANFASKRTSGIESWGHCHVVNCSFLNNDAGTCPGGALTVTGTAEVENCVFKNNEGQRNWRDPETGGTIGAAVFIGNPDGGALYVTGTARVSDCVFSGNSGYRGHTIGVFGGSLTMDRCKVVNSIASTSGGNGAIAVQGGELTINNSLIANSGNVIFFHIGNANTRLNNSTVANNAGEAAFWFNSVSNSSVIEMNNCIFSGYPNNLQRYELGNEGTLVVNNTLMNQPGIGGDNDPMFVNPTTVLGIDESLDALDADWTLQEGSPCINAGDVTLLDLEPLAIDLAGEPRVKGGQIDMGAYEYGIYHMVTALADPEEGGTISGTGTFDPGETVTLLATPQEGYSFVNWTENGEVVSTDPEYSFLATASTTLTAHFQIHSYEIAASVTPDGYGTISGSGVFDYGTTIALTATPNEECHFTCWTENGEVVSREATYRFLVKSERFLVANFELNSYDIALMTNPTEGGTVTGEGTYYVGEFATLIATANEHYSFINWTINGEEVSTTASFDVIVTETATYIANFLIDSHEITAIASPESSGTIEGTGSYNYGENATLSATANEGYHFVNWTENGEEVSAEASISFAVTKDRNLIANFELNSYDIALMTNPAEGGTVTGEGTYYHGETVTITAFANNGYSFINWTKDGIEVSTEMTYSFDVTETATFVANYEHVNYTIAVTADPPEGGSVTGSNNFYYGDMATLTATPNIGFTFVNWTLNGIIVSTSQSYSFTVTGPANFVAHFNHNSYVINTVANPPEFGTVDGAGTYYENDYCTLTATPNEGYVLDNWTLNGFVVSQESTYTFHVTGSVDLTANFVLKSLYTVTLADVVNGSVSTDQTSVFNSDIVTLTAVPDPGFFFSSWIVFQTGDATNMVMVTDNQFIMPSFDVTVYAVFKSIDIEEVTIGSGSNTNSYLPTNSSFNYSLTQQIYNANEIGGPCSITAISYKVSNSTSTTRMLDVYLKHTPKDGFADGWIVCSENNRVYSGSVTFSATGWTTITFDAPFEYDGINNLVVSVDDNTGSSNSDEVPVFYAFRGSNNCSIRYCNNLRNPNPISPNASGTRLSQKNQIIFTKSVTVLDTHLSITPETPSKFTYIEGQGPSEIKSFDVIGSNTIDNIIVFAPDDFEISDAIEGPYNDFLNLSSKKSDDSRNMSWDFEEDQLLWTTIDADGDGYNWILNKNNATLSHSGTNSLKSASYESGILTPDNWLVSPEITLGGVFSIWACAMDEEYAAEHFGIFVSTTSNNNPLAFTKLNEWTLSAKSNGYNGGGNRGNDRSSAWRQYSVDLNAYAGLSGYIAIRHFDCTDQYYLVVDDFTLDSEASFDEPLSPLDPLYGIETSSFYVRLKAGLSKGDYSNEILTVNAGNISRDIVLNGEVFSDVVNVENTFTLSGWNWWSANQDVTLNDVYVALGNHSTSIVSQNGSNTYLDGLGWDGDIDEIDLAKMYKIYVNGSVEVTLDAPTADPAQHPITIKKGINWIGYPCQETMAVKDALAGLNATSGDRIKSEGKTATFLGSSWTGTLKNLEPNHGYLYTAKAAKSFTYPTGAKATQLDAEEPTFWTPERTRFASNMNVLAVLNLDGVDQTSPDIEIGAFVNGECRDAVRLIHFEETGQDLALFTISGENGEIVHFKALRDGQVIDLNETVTVALDVIIGDFRQPFVLHNGSESQTLFPNPVEQGRMVYLNLSGSFDDATIEVIDMTGRVLVARRMVEAKQGLSTEGMASGIYTVRIISGNHVDTRKLVVR